MTKSELIKKYVDATVADLTPEDMEVFIHNYITDSLNEEELWDILDEIEVGCYSEIAVEYKASHPDTWDEDELEAKQHC